MSSSFRLRKRFEEAPRWLFQHLDDPLGGWSDTYIKPQGNCHPDFTGIPIGRPDGVKICFRRKVDGQRLDIPPDADFKKTILPEMSGYYRFSPSLYSVKDDYPQQLNNPQYYWDRRIPFQNTLTRDDYLREEIGYNTTGLKNNRVESFNVTTNKGDPEKQKWFEYGLDYMPNDKGTTEWTPMSRGEIFIPPEAKQGQSLPPYKWDVTRLHQLYPLYKQSQQYHDNPISPIRDQKHFDRVI